MFSQESRGLIFQIYRTLRIEHFIGDTNDASNILIFSIAAVSLTSLRSFIYV